MMTNDHWVRAGESINNVPHSPNQGNELVARQESRRMILILGRDV